MPHLIPRTQALSRIGEEHRPGECLACRLLNNSRYILHRGKHVTVALPAFPRSWGQTIVILNKHKTSVSETTSEEWQELAENSRKAAASLERLLRPARCYIASLGAAHNLPNSCPHLHFNVMPVYSSEEKPEDIFTWKHGVYDGTTAEWEEIFNALRSEFLRASTNHVAQEHPL